MDEAGASRKLSNTINCKYELDCAGLQRDSRILCSLSSRNRSNHNKRLLAAGDGVGEWGVGRFVGEIFFAGEKAQEGAALFGVVVAYGSAQHGIADLERIQHGALRDWAFNFERYLGVGVRQGSEVEGKNDADHVQILEAYILVLKQFITRMLMVGQLNL